MKQLRIVYGFNPFWGVRKYFPVYYSEVWLIGANGGSRKIAKFNCDDRLDHGTSWRNGALTAARKFAEEEAAFFGVKPERMENNKVVPRSFNYSTIIGK